WPPRTPPSREPPSKPEKSHTAGQDEVMRTGFPLGTLFSLAAAPYAAAPDIPTHTVVPRGLDKGTGRVSTLAAHVGAPVTFGRLEILPRACLTRPPEETPENAAFLEVTGIDPEKGPVQIFSGWMFASTPALSALDHAVYDIWVLR